MNIVHLLLTPYFNFSLYLLGKKRKSDGEHAKGFKVKTTPPPLPSLLLNSLWKLRRKLKAIAVFFF
jgi:hypothetical protein